MSNEYIKRYSYIALIQRFINDEIQILLGLRNWNVFYFINKSQNDSWIKIEEFLEEVSQTTEIDRKCLAPTPIKIHKFYQEVFAQTENQMGHYQLRLIEFSLPEDVISKIKVSDTLQWFSRKDIEKKITSSGIPIAEVTLKYLDMLGYNI